MYTFKNVHLRITLEFYDLKLDVCLLYKTHTKNLMCAYKFYILQFFTLLEQKKPTIHVSNFTSIILVQTITKNEIDFYKKELTT